jgi:hypothetical protein
MEIKNGVGSIFLIASSGGTTSNGSGGKRLRAVE